MSQGDETGTTHVSDAAASAPPRSAVPASRWKVALVLAAVFAFGGVAGGSLGRTLALREIAPVFRGPPGESRVHFKLEAMRRSLGLTDAQTAELAAIFTESEDEREKLLQPCRAGLDALRTKTNDRIRAVLTPEQRARYDERERSRPAHPRGERGGRGGHGDRGHGPPPPGEDPPPPP